MALLRTLDDKIRISIEEGQTFSVGRLPDCDVQLEDGSVSSHHAQLSLKDQVLHLQDLGSTNGTRVNYAQVDEPTLLLNGDTIEFGNVTFTVDAPELTFSTTKTPTQEAFTSLEPIQSSEPIENTMQIHGVSHVDVEDPKPAPASKPEAEKPALSPSTVAFLISAAVLLVAVGVLLVEIAGIDPLF